MRSGRNMGFSKAFGLGGGHPRLRGRKDYNKLNCMSYALKLDEWGQVASRKHFHVDTAFIQYMADMGLQLTSREKMVPGKVYIAYKFGYDDFHWAIRNEKGHWRHKCGGRPSESVSEKVVFAKKWRSGLIYSSKTFVFEYTA